MHIGRTGWLLSALWTGVTAAAGVGCTGPNAGDGGSGGAAGSNGGSGGNGGSSPAAVQFYRDVKPIFDAKCNGCHTAGGIAPFALQAYDDAQPVMGLIKEKVSSKQMPPWPPNDSCAEYVGDRSLSADQIDTISKWVDGGGAAGDPKDEGKPLPTGEVIKLSRVDLSMKIPVSYTQKTTPDDYHCFVIDWPYQETKYVSGFRANPGDARVVHHVIAFLVAPGDVAQIQSLDAGEDGPGYTCFGGSGINANEWLGAWAPGTQGSDFPPGTGIKVEPGSKIALQVHYNSLNGGPRPDQTSIDFKIDDTVEKEGKIQPWTNPTWLSGNKMDIPAGQKDVKHAFQYDPTQFLTGGKPFTMYSGSLHMHTLGTNGLLSIHRKGGADECMLQIDDWNFHWQGSYGFTQPKVFNPGDQLYLECHWDNSGAKSPGAPKDTWWGEGTTDEMCLGGFYWTE